MGLLYVYLLFKDTSRFFLIYGKLFKYCFLILAALLYHAVNSFTVKNIRMERPGTFL